MKNAAHRLLQHSLVFGAVWPMYCPTRGRRVTATMWPAHVASQCRICAIRATVVLPVPGLPVKHMCSSAPARHAEVAAQPVDHEQRGDVADR